MLHVPFFALLFAVISGYASAGVACSFHMREFECDKNCYYYNTLGHFPRCTLGFRGRLYYTVMFYGSANHNPRLEFLGDDLKHSYLNLRTNPAQWHKGSFVVGNKGVREFNIEGSSAALRWTLIVTAPNCICPSGYVRKSVCNENNDAVCVKNCPAGQWADGDTCRFCQAGWYGNTNALTTCYQCPVGKYAAGPGKEKCTDCPVGTYALHEGTVTCSSCPLGSFNPQTGQQTCQRCPANTFGPNMKASSCTPCDQGTVDSSFTGREIPCASPPPDTQSMQSRCTAQHHFALVNVKYGYFLQARFPVANDKFTPENMIKMLPRYGNMWDIHTTQNGISRSETFELVEMEQDKYSVRHVAADRYYKMSGSLVPSIFAVNAIENKPENLWRKVPMGCPHASSPCNHVGSLPELSGSDSTCACGKGFFGPRCELMTMPLNYLDDLQLVTKCGRLSLCGVDQVYDYSTWECESVETSSSTTLLSMENHLALEAACANVALDMSTKRTSMLRVSGHVEGYPSMTGTWRPLKCDSLFCSLQHCKDACANFDECKATSFGDHCMLFVEGGGLETSPWGGPRARMQRVPLRVAGNVQCLAARAEPHLQPCSNELDNNEMWMFDHGLLRRPDGSCLAVDLRGDGGVEIKLVACDRQDSMQWFTVKHDRVVFGANSLCLGHNSGALTIVTCDDTDALVTLDLAQFEGPPQIFLKANSRDSDGSRLLETVIGSNDKTPARPAHADRKLYETKPGHSCHYFGKGVRCSKTCTYFGFLPCARNRKGKVLYYVKLNDSSASSENPFLQFYYDGKAGHTRHLAEEEMWYMGQFDVETGLLDFILSRNPEYDLAVSMPDDELDGIDPVTGSLLRTRAFYFAQNRVNLMHNEMANSSTSTTHFTDPFDIPMSRAFQHHVPPMFIDDASTVGFNVHDDIDADPASETPPCRETTCSEYCGAQWGCELGSGAITEPNGRECDCSGCTVGGCASNETPVPEDGFQRLTMASMLSAATVQLSSFQEIGPFGVMVPYNGLALGFQTVHDTLADREAKKHAVDAFFHAHNPAFHVCHEIPCPCNEIRENGVCTPIADLSTKYPAKKAKWYMLELYHAYGLCALVNDELLATWSPIPGSAFLSHGSYCSHDVNPNDYPSGEVEAVAKRFQGIASAVLERPGLTVSDREGMSSVYTMLDRFIVKHDSVQSGSRSMPSMPMAYYQTQLDNLQDKLKVVIQDAKDRKMADDIKDYVGNKMDELLHSTVQGQLSIVKLLSEMQKKDDNLEAQRIANQFDNQYEDLMSTTQSLEDQFQRLISVTVEMMGENSLWDPNARGGELARLGDYSLQLEESLREFVLARYEQQSQVLAVKRAEAAKRQADAIRNLILVGIATIATTVVTFGAAGPAMAAAAGAGGIASIGGMVGRRLESAGLASVLAILENVDGIEDVVDVQGMAEKLKGFSTGKEHPASRRRLSNEADIGEIIGTIEAIDVADVGDAYSIGPNSQRAHAFAQGSDIRFEELLEASVSHEAWHTLQNEQRYVESLAVQVPGFDGEITKEMLLQDLKSQWFGNDESELPDSVKLLQSKTKASDSEMRHLAYYAYKKFALAGNQAAIDKHGKWLDAEFNKQLEQGATCSLNRSLAGPGRSLCGRPDRPGCNAVACPTSNFGDVDTDQPGRSKYMPNSSSKRSMYLKGGEAFAAVASALASIDYDGLSSAYIKKYNDAKADLDQGYVETLQFVDEATTDLNAMMKSAQETIMQLNMEVMKLLSGDVDGVVNGGGVDTLPGFWDRFALSLIGFLDDELMICPLGRTGSSADGRRRLGGGIEERQDDDAFGSLDAQLQLRGGGPSSTSPSGVTMRRSLTAKQDLQNAQEDLSEANVQYNGATSKLFQACGRYRTSVKKLASMGKDLHIALVDAIELARVRKTFMNKISATQSRMEGLVASVERMEMYTDSVVASLSDLKDNPSAVDQAEKVSRFLFNVVAQEQTLEGLYAAERVVEGYCRVWSYIDPHGASLSKCSEWQALLNSSSMTVTNDQTLAMLTRLEQEFKESKYNAGAYNDLAKNVAWVPLDEVVNVEELRNSSFRNPFTFQLTGPCIGGDNNLTVGPYFPKKEMVRIYDIGVVFLGEDGFAVGPEISGNALDPWIRMDLEMMPPFAQTQYGKRYEYTMDAGTIHHDYQVLPAGSECRLESFSFSRNKMNAWCPEDKIKSDSTVFLSPYAKYRVQITEGQELLTKEAVKVMLAMRYDAQRIQVTNASICADEQMESYLERLARESEQKDALSSVEVALVSTSGVLLAAAVVGMVVNRRRHRGRYGSHGESKVVKTELSAVNPACEAVDEVQL